MLNKRSFALFAAISLAGSMWFYVQYILIAHQKAEAAARNIPRGNLSDLYPRWLGARELLLRHRDPYSPELTREIQAGYYGRPLDPSRPNDPEDRQAFAYPVYVVFLLAPTITLRFPVVQVGFRWFLIALVLLSVVLWLRILRWKLSPAALAAACILTLGSFQVLQGLKLQQLSLFVSGLIAACLLSLVNGHLVAAGILLALVTIKPQLVALLIVWLFFWSLGRWKERRNLVWSFLASMGVLFAASFYILPGWMQEFWRAAHAYRNYNAGALSILEVFLTPFWGRLLSILIVFVLTIVCWRNRRVTSDSPQFAWVTSLVLAITILTGPKTSPYNQVLLLPAVFLIFKAFPALWETNLRTRLTLLIFMLIFLWPWLAALSLTTASLFAPISTIQRSWVLPLYANLILPILVVALLVLGFPQFLRAIPASLGEKS